MKVLYFHQYFKTPRGAGGTRSYEMAQRLILAGHEVTMVCGSGSHSSDTGVTGDFIHGRREGLVDGIYVIELELPYSNHHSFLRRTAREVNDAKPDWVVSQVTEEAARLREPVIACLGLAYKPDVDDLRESPAVRIAETLDNVKIGQILAVEPYCEALPQSLEDAGVTAVTLDETMERADLLVAFVPHRPFRQLNASQVQKKMIVDACGLLRLL